MASGLQEKYGAFWKTDLDKLQIEFGCIQRGGKWRDSKGNECGLGLLEHYRNAMRLCWPRHDENRWSNLLLENFLANKITAVLGPASSAKTFNAARFALIDYWAFPSETCILVSSTDVRGLELRVWGKIKELWAEGVERFDWLSGTPIDYLHAITTDDLGDEETRVRVLNKGIICIPCLASGKYVGLGKYLGIKQKRVRLIGDECFPTGTLVDTTYGPRPIEHIRCGDYVKNAVGFSRVLATSSRLAKSLIRLHLSNGQTITATPNHPFLTNSGWRKCVDINPRDELISTDEALHHLSGSCEGGWSSKILFRRMSEKGHGESVRTLRNHVCSIGKEGGFLYSVLCREVENGATGNRKENDCGQRLGGDWQEHQSGDNAESCGEEKAISFNQEEFAPDDWWKNPVGRATGSFDAIGVDFARAFPERSSELQDCNGHGRETRSISLFQNRFGLSGRGPGGRGRWKLPLRRPDNQGRQSGRVFERARVDRVEIFEQTDFEGYDESAGGYRVHNLQVEGHPSYSVNGVLVHNCQLMGPTFLDAISNLGANQDFKAGLLGNPIDPMDPLGLAAEPYEGWTAMPEPEKTAVWVTRFQGGKAVNLVGTDSPNNDFPGDKPKFPYLIHQKRIEEVEAFWGKDSLQYYSQAVGVMKSGLLTFRVITMDLCRNHQAFEKAVWSSEQRTRVYAIDVAYGGVGGDRCIAGWGEFGPDQDGHQILRVNPPVTVPVSIKNATSPEDQIADFVKQDAGAARVPPENTFYDSTGRGTMGSAFARKFGSITPVPVEFGGRPSKRPVRLDLFINDEARHGEQRHKRCDEHYYDFVTELWFSSRYAIESDQIRELPNDVAREGCQRKYEMTPGNKYAVESKHDPKARERMPESPDKYDWFVTLLEGARRLGFQINRLGIEFVEQNDDDYQDEESFHDLIQSKMLVHA